MGRPFAVESLRRTPQDVKLGSPNGFSHPCRDPFLRAPNRRPRECHSLLHRGWLVCALTAACHHGIGVKPSDSDGEQPL